MRRGVGGVLALALLATAFAGCGPQSSEKHLAEAAFVQLGCGTCHSIPGVTAANGRVGPSLASFGERREIAGRVPNTEAALVRWILDPQGVEPGTLMPDVGATDEQARAMADYLEGLGNPNTSQP
jgi:cytochrome c